MPKKPKLKFSISIDHKLLAEIEHFREMYNLQYILPMDRAKAIRILIRHGLKHQQVVPGAREEESEWWHQEKDGKILCGATSERTRPWGSAEDVTCPRCILAKRHAGPMIMSD